MTVPSRIVGQHVGSSDNVADERWLMSYAAGIGDHNARYLDTGATQPIVAHPLFPVCLEWPAIVGSQRALAELGLGHDPAPNVVHATHHLEIGRLICPGERMRTDVTIAGVESRRSGVLITLALDTVDAAGQLVARSQQGMLYFGETVVGEECPVHLPIPDVQATWTDASVVTQRDVAFDRLAAHVYTECARIWNPIHTSRAVALAAGLPDIILHGSATLAHAVTAIVDERCGGDPHVLRSVAGRFRAPVLLPSTVTICISDRVPSSTADVVWFRVLTADSRHAIDDGYVVIDR